MILGGGGPQIDDGISRAAQLKEGERELNIPRGKIVSISPSLSSADTRIMDSLRIKTQNIYMTSSRLHQNLPQDEICSLRASFQYVGMTLNYQFTCISYKPYCVCSRCSRGGGRGRGGGDKAASVRSEIAEKFLPFISVESERRAACDDSDADRRKWQNGTGSSRSLSLNFLRESISGGLLALPRNKNYTFL